MHEFALIQNLLEIIQQEIKTHKPPQSTIRGLTLTVGALELHSIESFRQAFDIESKGTELEGISLELTIAPAEVECSGCGFNGPLPDEKADPHSLDFMVECPQCGAPSAIKGGRGIQKIELVLDP